MKSFEWSEEIEIYVIGEFKSSFIIAMNLNSKLVSTRDNFQNIIEPSSCPVITILSSYVSIFETISAHVKFEKLQFYFSKVLNFEIMLRFNDSKHTWSVYIDKISLVFGLCFILKI